MLKISEDWENVLLKIKLILVKLKEFRFIGKILILENDDLDIKIWEMNIESLFEELGIAKTDIELQNIQNKYSEFDLMYVKYCVGGNYNKKERNFFDNIFLKNKEYLDLNFKSALKQKGGFNQRLWELYLISYLNKNLYSLEKSQKCRPDILVNYNNVKIFIECVASTKGEGNNKIHDFLDYSGNIDNIDIPRKLRLTSSLDQKMKKINCYILDNVININKGDCCIIALNGGESYGNFINNGIGSLLFGYGKTFYKNNGGNSEGPYYEKLYNLVKINGSIIDIGLFNNQYYNHISGILFLGSSIYDVNDFDLEGINYNCFHYGKNNYEKLIMIKNPNSINKIPEGFLKNIETIYDIK